MPIKINSFSVKTRGKAFQYDVLFEVKSGEKVVKLNKDRVDIQDKITNYKLLAAVHERTNRFGNNANYLYDGVSIMYTNTEIKEIEHVLPIKELPNDLKPLYRHDIHIKITPTEGNHILDLNKPVENMSPNEVGEYKRIISLAVSQDAINRGQYFVAGDSKMYKSGDAPAPINRHECEFRIGFSKGVRFVKTTNGLYPVVDIDYCTGAFYRAQSVADVFHDLGFKQNNRAESVSNFLKNVTIYPNYNPHRRLRFVELIKETPKQFQVPEKNMTVYEYFLKEKNINLKQNLPLIKVKPVQAGVFPPEAAYILAFQKISNEQLEPQILDALHKANAVHARDRYQHIERIVQDLRLDNELNKSFGIQIDTRMYECRIAPIVKPSVQFKDGETQPKMNGNFEGKFRYVLPAKITDWAVVCAGNTDKRQIDYFLKNRLLAKANEMGMTLAPPKDISSVDFRRVQAINDKVEAAKKKGCKYILFIEAKFRSISHNYIKMLECVHQIVTQQLDYKTVEKCGNVTLGNIVNKMNLKNGGINYAPKIDKDSEVLALDKGTFVIGLFARHSRMAPQRVGKTEVVIREPSVVGITANCSFNASSFVGNFKYQRDPRSVHDAEIIDSETLTEQVFKFFILLKKNRPQKPQRIVVLRDGISTYNFERVSRDEVRALKAACTKFDPKWNPQFIYLATTKDHGIRVFNCDKGQVNNPIPGTVIADDMVDRGNEFLIAAQNAFKGTAKSVCVDVLINETNIKLPSIIKFIHSLCYNHQLTCASVALPEPVYQAGILTERGHYVLKAFKEVFPNQVPKDGVQYDIKRLNQMLSINNDAMESCRFTA